MSKHISKSMAALQRRAKQPRPILQFDGTAICTPIAFTGVEGINQIAEYQLEVAVPPQGDPSAWSRKAIRRIGRQLLGHDVRFGIDDGVRVRWRGGIVVGSHSEGIVNANGAAVLHLAVRPSLARLDFTRRFRTFVDADVISVTRAVFAEHGLGEPLVRLDGEWAGPAKTQRVQYGESDLAFLMRWWEEEHLNFCVLAGNSASQVVLFESPSRLAGNDDAVLEVRLGALAGDREIIHALTDRFALGVGTTATGDFDLFRPESRFTATLRSARGKGGGVGGLGTYQVFPCGARSRAEAQRRARRLRASFEAECEVISATGNVRCLAAGDRPRLREERVTIIRLRFDARQEPAEEMRVWFEAVPEDAEVAPTPGSVYKPIAPGLCPGVVVVDEGDPANQGRVRVRLAVEPQDSPGLWCAVSNPGDLTCRPRKGQHVDVGFEFGDIDRPRVTACADAANTQPLDPNQEKRHTGFRTLSHESILVDADEKGNGAIAIQRVGGNCLKEVQQDEVRNIGGSQATVVAGASVLRAPKIRLVADEIVLCDTTGKSFLKVSAGGITGNGGIIHWRDPSAMTPTALKLTDTVPPSRFTRNRRSKDNRLRAAGK